MRHSASELRRLVYGGNQPEKPPAPVFDRLDAPHLDALMQSKMRPVDAVPTPWPNWTAVCGNEGGREGLARGWTVTVGAKTGVGKSIILCNAAWMALAAGAQVSFLSLEMSQAQLETRLLAMIAGCPVRELEQGRSFSRFAFEKAVEVALDLQERAGGGFSVNRRQIHSLASALDAMREQHEVYGSRLFLVDYLQLAGNPNDPESITEVSHCIRGLTVDLNVTTIAASQFNRATSATDERPRSQGLMGGSALENDSDQVVLIDHSRDGARDATRRRLERLRPHRQEPSRPASRDPDPLRQPDAPDARAWPDERGAECRVS